MKPFRSRLTLILLLLVGVSVLAAGLTMAKVFRDSHIHSLEEYMGREISLLEDLLELPALPEGSAATHMTPGEFVARIRRLLEVNPALLTEETTAELARVFTPRQPPAPAPIRRQLGS